MKFETIDNQRGTIEGLIQLKTTYAYIEGDVCHEDLHQRHVHTAKKFWQNAPVLVTNPDSIHDPQRGVTKFVIIAHLRSNDYAQDPQRMASWLTIIRYSSVLVAPTCLVEFLNEFEWKCHAADFDW